MILPFHIPLASFDHAPQAQVEHASGEWVQACLHRHPLTQHLIVRVREEGDVIVLEGQAPTRMDRQWAGSVAQHAMGGGEMHNRLLVLDDLDGPQWAPVSTFSRPLPMATAA